MRAKGPSGKGQRSINNPEGGWTHKPPEQLFRGRKKGYNQKGRRPNFAGLHVIISRSFRKSQKAVKCQGPGELVTDSPNILHQLNCIGRWEYLGAQHPIALSLSDWNYI